MSFLKVVCMVAAVQCLAAGIVASATAPLYTLDKNLYESEIRSLFQSWQKTHFKLYSSRVMDERFNVFKDNVRYIIQHNIEQRTLSSSSRMGLTKFADLTHAEFQALHFPMQLQSKGNSTSWTPFRYASIEEVPAAVDWRQKGVVTAVKEQGQCGACWAFSTTGSVEGVNSIVSGELVSLSEQELIDCDETNRNHGCKGGLMDYAFDYIINNGGLRPEVDYPYIASTAPCRTQKDNTQVITIDSYADVPTNSEIDLQKAVAHQPISIAVDASSRDWQHYVGGVFKGTCGVSLDHGVLLVGYGIDAEDGSDYWIVKNSWGMQWGEQGYIRLKRNVQDPRGACGLAIMPSYPIKTSSNPPIPPIQRATSEASTSSRSLRSQLEKLNKYILIALSSFSILLLCKRTLL